MTKAEREHLDRLQYLGCIVCRNEGYGYTPPAIHHLRSGAGMSQRGSHFEAIPLCPTHHNNGGHGVALHAGQKTWEAKFGTERELLAQVRGLLGIEVAQ